MSETTATRIARTGTLAAAAIAWCACAWLLARTTVPSLRLSGVDPHRYFAPRLLTRTERFARGEDVLFAVRTLAALGALALLSMVVPRRVGRSRRGRTIRTIAAATVVLVTLWLVQAPFAVADLWWQHHWGLAPFDLAGWLEGQASSAGPEAVAALVVAVLLVALAARSRRWWLIAAPIVVALVACFLLVSGWLAAVGTEPLRDARLVADVRRLERAEHVPGTPVRVQDVSAQTRQPNAFAEGFGPSARVVLWSTLLDGRFTRREIDVVIAHELGHVRSRHVLKGIGWTALAVLPVLWLLDRATRRLGGVGDPANLPFGFLLVAVLLVVVTPAVNAVSRRYEAEADWRALNAARDPAAQQRLFEKFAETSLEQPSPPLLDYVWLENHPTPMQRIVMAKRWPAASGRPSRGGPGSP
jgi:STE24 endopeptidase